MAGTDDGQSRETGYILGLGCRRGATAGELVALAGEALRDARIAPGHLTAIATIDTKKGEAVLDAVAAHFGVPVRFFDAATLERETPRLQNPSASVHAETGCHGVAESAALAAAGPGSTLAVAKIRSKSATAAIARA